MASSKVMASSSPANQDLQRHQPLAGLITDHNNNNTNLISMNMDDLLKNMYDESRPMPDNFTVDGGDVRDPEMTLEDFLTKAGAVRQEDVVKLSPVICNGNGDGGVLQGVTQQLMQFNGVSNGGGRGKRKVVVEDPPVDKATQQKQRRMIKNRESAARSRERKQAYTLELESLVTQLEEEHARLLKEVDELNKERLKQLMENLMPVAEKRRPPRLLRRTNSM